MKYILNVSIDYSKNYIYTPSFIYDIIKLYQKYFFYFLSLTLFYKRIENNYDRSQFTSDEIIIDNFNHINNLIRLNQRFTYFPQSLSPPPSIHTTDKPIGQSLLRGWWCLGFVFLLQ